MSGFQLKIRLQQRGGLNSPTWPNFVMAGPTTLRICLAMPALSFKTLRSKQNEKGEKLQDRSRPATNF
jgi:hypothetical protein